MLGYDYGYELYATAPRKFSLFYPSTQSCEVRHEVDYGYSLHRHLRLSWWERVLTVLL